jgi:hypothetical protein
VVGHVEQDRQRPVRVGVEQFVKVTFGFTIPVNDQVLKIDQPLEVQLQLRVASPPFFMIKGCWSSTHHPPQLGLVPTFGGSGFSRAVLFGAVCGSGVLVVGVGVGFQLGL